MPHTTETLESGFEDPAVIIARARAARSRFIADLLRQGFAALTEALRQRRTLAALNSLSARELADIGIDANALHTGAIRRVETAYAAGTWISPAKPDLGHAATAHLTSETPAAPANVEERSAA